MNNSSIVHKVVTAIADAKDVNPSELDFVLANYVDPGLLEQAVSMESGACKVTFQVAGHEVTVTDAGTVFVDGVSHEGCQADTVQWPEGVRDSFVGGGQNIVDLFDTIPGVVYYSPNERGWPVEFVTEGCRELTGYDPNAFVLGGLDYGYDVIHSEDMKSVCSSMKQALRDRESFELTYRIQTADGTYKWVLEKGTGLYEGGSCAGRVGFITELADQNRPHAQSLAERT